MSYMQPVQLPPVLAAILGVPVAPREAVERTIQAAIDALDLMDGDDDAEEDDAEDSFVISPRALRHADKGPGDPISDPGGGNVEDTGELVNEDGCDHEDQHLAYGVDQSEAEPLHWSTDRGILMPHVRRLRASRKFAVPLRRW